MPQRQNLVAGAAVVVIGAVVLWAAVQPSGTDMEKTCGVENCHGLDVVCGSEPAEVCTEEYVTGDVCRQYASCQVVNGECTTVTPDTYDRCRSCVENCLAQQEQQENFDVLACEDRCREQLP